MKNIRAVFIATCLLSLSTTSMAGEWYSQTTFNSRVEADSNKRLRSDNEKGVAGADARLDIKLSNVTEISEVYVRGALRSVRYDGSDERGVDTDDQLLYAGGRWTGERSQLTLDGEYLRQSSQFTELQDTGFFEDVNRRVDKELSSQYSYVLMENTQLFVGGNYREVEFPNTIPVSLTEFSIQGVNVGVVHDFNELNSVTLSVYHSDYEADTFTSDVETNGANIRYDKVINEIWSGHVGAGYRKSNFKRAPLGIITRDDSTGGTYEVGVVRELQRSTFNAELTNTLEPSADGDVNERTDIRFGYRRALSSRLTTSADLHWFEDESVNNNTDADREYWTISLGADYRLTPHWYVTGQFRHREQEIESSTDTVDADSDAVMIGVRYQGNRKRI